MRKNIFILTIILLCSCNNSERRPSNDTRTDTTRKETKPLGPPSTNNKLENNDTVVNRNDFETIVDFVGCKLLEFSVRSLNSEDILKDFNDNCKCEKSERLNDAITAFISRNDSSGKLKFASLYKEISEVINQYDKLKGEKQTYYFFSEGIFQDTLPGTVLARFTRNRSFDNTLATLKQQLTNYLQEKGLNGPLPLSPANSNPKLLEEIQLMNSKIANQSLLVSISLLLALGSIVLTFMVWLFKRKQKNSNNNTDILRGEIKYWKEENAEELKNIRVWVQEEIVRATRKISEIEKNIQSDFMDNPSIPLLVEQEDSAQKKNDFFSSAPEPNGDFKIDNITETERKGASIFVFKLIGNSKAEYRVLNTEDAAMLAMNSYNQVISIACIEEAPFDSNARRIITVTPGLVELSGTVWKQIEKVKINYQL